MKRIVLFLLLINCFALTAQLDRVEPPNWWVGFKNGHLQLLLKGKDISSMEPEIVYPGVHITGVHKGSSSNYLFIDLNIEAQTEPGTFEIVLNSGKRKKIRAPYTLKKRLKSGEEFYGFDSSDVIYLIPPDRFANGNPDNDVVKGLKEAVTSRVLPITFLISQIWDLPRYGPAPC